MCIRDSNKDAEFLNQFKLLLTGQYQGAQVSPSGANRFRKGSHGRENEWRRLQIGFEAVFFKNRLTLHSLTNMGELDGMYKVEDGRWRRTKTDWSIFELYLKYKVNPSFFARVGKITSKKMCIRDSYQPMYAWLKGEAGSGFWSALAAFGRCLGIAGHPVDAPMWFLRDIIIYTAVAPLLYRMGNYMLWVGIIMLSLNYFALDLARCV